VPQPESDSLHYSIAIGLLQADLLLPLCRSLKDKRSILAKTLNHVRKQHPVAVAEVGDHDLWGRAGIAAVTVSGDRALAENILRAVSTTLEHDREVQLVDYNIQIL
jgi:uncharacterized protein YlxP (DUF503 family)